MLLCPRVTPDHVSRCSPVAEAEADLAPDGSRVAGRYHVEYYGYKPTFYDIGNTCSLDQAGSDITTTVTVQYSAVQYSTVQ